MTVPSTFKFLLKRNDKACKFDTNLHKWVELCDYSALTTTNFTTSGLTYTQLTTSYTTQFLAYTETETLSDGSKVYESETITPEMGVTGLDEATINNIDYLQITVPAFTPKSMIDDETEELLCYTGSEAPFIDVVEPSLENVHSDNILLTVTVYATWNIGYKINGVINNNNLTQVDVEANNSVSYSDIVIPNNTLKIGSNNIDITCTYVGSSTYTRKQTFNNIINKINNVPSIEVLESSTAYKLLFNIEDKDKDKTSYKISISNSKYTNEEIILDWRNFSNLTSIEYEIDTEYIVAAEENTLKIYVKDNFDETSISTSEYKFVGKYKGLSILDADNNYLCNDNKVSIKVMNLGMIPAGLEQEPVMVKLLNNKPTKITGIQINTLIDEMAPGAKVVYCKTNNPFIGTESITFDEIGPNKEETFYMRIETTAKKLGTCSFKIGVKGIDE